MSDITRFPLCWPDNVPRRAPGMRAYPQFTADTYLAEVREIRRQVNLLNQRRSWHDDESVIVSTNLPVKQNGEPYAGQGNPSDPAVAVYFQLRFFRGNKSVERPLVFACDRWVRVEQNLSAIGRHIDAQRAQTRYGCGSIEQAFRGYLAIPERCGGVAWWDVLRVPSNANRESIETAYRQLVKVRHPDKGGSHLEFTKLLEAYEQAMAQFSQQAA